MISFGGGFIRAIYGYPALQMQWGCRRPNRIIVRNGKVTLEGVVNSEADKNVADVRANSVSRRFFFGDQ